MTNKRWTLPVILALVTVLGLAAPMATAQIDDPTTLHFNCTGTTTCTQSPPNPTSEVVTSAGNPTFTITTQSNSGLANGAKGTLFMVILVPNANSLPNTFSVNGGTFSAVNAAQFTTGQKLEDASVLNFSLHATSNPNFAAFQSASAQVRAAPASFTVYTVNLGTVTAPAHGFANGTVLATVNSFGVKLPAGTVLYAVLVSGSTSNPTLSGQSAVNTSPLSHSLTVTGTTLTPEPTSMLLFGSGFVLLGGVLRRRFSRL